MRGVDHDHVAFGIHQRFGAGKALVANGGRRRHAQAACGILGGIGVQHGLFNVLHRDQAHAVIGIVYHQQLLDTAGMEQAARFLLADAFGDGRQIIACHQFAHRLHRVVGKTHIAVGEDAHQLSRRIDHRNPADAVLRHQCLRLAQRGIGRDRDGVDHHAAFKALHPADCGALLLDRQIAVQHANPAQLRHYDGHLGLGHRVHRGGQHRNVEGDAARQPCPRARLAGHDVALARPKEDVVKCQAGFDFHLCHLVLRASIARSAIRGGPCNRMV